MGLSILEDDEEAEDSMFIYEEEERGMMATMRRVEERIDALEAEAAYKEGTVESLRDELVRHSRASSAARGNPALQKVFDHLNQLSQIEAQALLRRCCLKVAEMKEKEEDVKKYREEADIVRQKLRIVCSDYEQQLVSRDDKLICLSTEKNAALNELRNLKSFLRDRTNENGFVKIGKSTEDL